MDTLKTLVSEIQSMTTVVNKGVTFIAEPEREEYLSYSGLYSQALKVLHQLQNKGINVGDELLFQIQDNQKFLVTFWACILGGIIPAPIPPAANGEQLEKLYRVWNLLNHPWLVSDFNVSGLFTSGEAGNPVIKQIEARQVSIGQVGPNDPDGIIYNAKPDDIAYLQFSSGSTGEPKGVVLTHQNLVSNVYSILAAVKLNASDVTLSWVPLTHNLGLIGFHITPLLGGINQFIMPTVQFLQNPVLWMRKAMEHQITITGSPNFGFKHLLTFLKPEDLRELDLSKIKIILNGAEPISALLNNQFLNVLSACQLRHDAIVPAYGMAEASVAVTISPVEQDFLAVTIDRNYGSVSDSVRNTEVGDDSGVTFVDVGYPVNGCRIRICDDLGILPEERIGYIQVKGDCVTPGYYNDPLKSQEARRADGWLQTGDLGFLRNGRLIITGRSKDIIFVNGKNFYPMDIERVADQTQLFAPGSLVACGIPNRDTKKDTIVLFAIYQNSLEQFVGIANDLKKQVHKKMGLTIERVIPVQNLPKSSSGKLQRFKLVEMYLEQQFQTVIAAIAKLEETAAQDRVTPTAATDTEHKLVMLFEEVLETKAINMNESLAELEINSLKAAELAVKINSQFNVQVSLNVLFDSSSIKELARYIETLKKKQFREIRPAEHREYYPLSSAQKRLYMLNRLNANTTNYNLTYSVVIVGRIDRKHFEASFNSLIQRQESLRTSFQFIQDNPVQIIHEDVKLEIEYQELRHRELNEIIKEFIRPFNLEVAPLFRVGLIKLDEERHLFVLDIHHIIADGASLGILRKEFVKLYLNAKLDPIKVQYKDFAVWQQAMQNSNAFKAQEQYWLERFGGEIPVINLPWDYVRPATNSFEGDKLSFIIAADLTEKINQFVSQTGFTLYMLLLAAYNVLLFKYTGQEDIIVGTPVFGRRSSKLRNVIGMFVNTLAMRNYPSKDQCFLEFLNEVKRNALEALDNQEYQFEELVHKLELHRDLSTNPLFNTMLVLQNVSNQVMKVGELQFLPYKVPHETAIFDLLIEVTKHNDLLELEIEYSTKLFKRETIQRIFNHFTNLLSQVVEHPHSRLEDINILTHEEVDTVINWFNATDDVGSHFTINQLFEEQVRKTPEKIAIVFNDQKITYKDLNERANQLAEVLLRQEVKPENVVGIIAERSPELIIAVLAVLKVGGAYVPIDPNYPDERKQYMVEDSHVKVILTNVEWQLHFDGTVIDIRDEQLYRGAAQNRSLLNTPDHLLYVIYTSGTTGQPKGVMLEHRTLVNLAFFHYQKTNIDFSQKVMQFANMSFDVCYQEIFLTLLRGGELHIIDEMRKRDVPKLLDFISRNSIEVVFLPTSYLKFMMNEGYLDSIPVTVKHIITAGEQLVVTPHFKEYLRDKEIYLHNQYGPSETHVATTYTMYQGSVEQIPSIGRPISNTRVYILDQNLKPQGIGIAGELFISGTAVGRGYMNRPELTKTKFLPDPFRQGERMYRTGDVAKWNSDGLIEFLGRIDHQVKIRGFRVELGEVETALLNYPSVKEAVVMARKDAKGGQYLCAYLVEKAALNLHGLREYLQKILPEYMMPSYFITLAKIPLTPNGKVNRNALPEPEKTVWSGAEYVAATSDLQERLIYLWEEILGVTPVGIHDNFFELGGHSLNATALVTRINKEFRVEIPLSDIFKHPTVSQLEKQLVKFRKTYSTAITPLPQSAYYPLSTGQKSIFLLDRITDTGTSYNMPGAIMIDGAVDKGKIESVFAQLLERNEILRTTFSIINEQPVQIVHSKVALNIEYTEIAEEAIEKTFREFVQPFDLAVFPLIRVKLLKLRANKHILCFDLHHIIADGLSLSILIQDFLTLYQGKRLEPLAIQYKDYAVWHNQLLESVEAKRSENYWLNQLKGFTYTQLPAETTFKNSIPSAGFREKRLSPGLAEAVGKYCRLHRITRFTLMFAVFNLLVLKRTNQKDLSIGIPIESRGTEELKNLIGMFLNVLVIRSVINTSQTFIEYLHRVNDQLVQAQEHQNYPYDELFLKMRQAGFKGKSLFSILFNYMPFDLLKETSTDANRFRPIMIKSAIQPKYDLTWYVSEANGGFVINIVYNAGLYEDFTINRLLDDFEAVLQTVISDEQIILADIDLSGGSSRDAGVNFDMEFDNAELI